MPSSTVLVAKKQNSRASLAVAIVAAAGIVLVGFTILTTLAQTTKTADLNNDSKIDVLDMSQLLSKWGTTDSIADINSDGTVNIIDLSILLSTWGSVSAPSSERWSTLHPFLSSAFSNTSVGSGILTASNSPMNASLQLHSAYINSKNWSFPVYEASATDPTWTITDGNGFTVTLKIPDTAAPSPGTDSHMSVTQPDKRTNYEMWRAYKDASGWHAEYIVKGDLLTDGRSGGARASAISHLHGLIRTEEVAANKIPHSLAMGIDDDQLKSGYVWPARGQDWDGNTAYTGTIPMGTMFILPKNVDLNALGLNEDGKSLAWTLQNYGAHVLLRAGTVSFYAETEVEAKYLTRLNNYRSAWAKLRPYMQVVTNNTSSNVAGGGTRSQPTLPEVIAR
jgi:hypothetical protein